MALATLNLWEKVSFKISIKEAFRDVHQFQQDPTTQFQSKRDSKIHTVGRVVIYADVSGTVEDI